MEDGARECLNETACLRLITFADSCCSVGGGRAAAEAWEAAFVELAHSNLSDVAAAAGLRLSFSAERSVADELARESYAEVSTVRARATPPSSKPRDGFQQHVVGLLSGQTEDGRGPCHGLLMCLLQGVSKIVHPGCCQLAVAPPVGLVRAGRFSLALSKRNGLRWGSQEEPWVMWSPVQS